MTRSVSQNLARLGRPVTSLVAYAVNLVLMVYLGFRSALVEQKRGMSVVKRVLAAQIYFTGVQALPLIGVIALATGGLIILNSAGEVTGNLFYLVVVQELGPLATALVVIARSGTAVASELGNMRANREVDALTVMGIDPMSFLVFPRVLGGVVSLLCLVFFFDLIAFLGGFLMVHLLHGVSFSYFLGSMTSRVEVADLFLIGTKTLVNGFLIFSIACFQGLKVSQSIHQVPQVTTRAVVLSISWVMLANVFLTALWSMGG